MVSMYDSVIYRKYFRKYKNDDVRKDYVDRKIRKMEHNHGSVSLYDLSQAAGIIKIFREAKEIYD